MTEYTIKKKSLLETEVVSEKNVYNVNPIKPFCNCLAFKYSKKPKKCKHIAIVRGIKNATTQS